MQKSSVYLPDALKRRLQAYAATSSQSEAQLIRAAIEAFLADDQDRPSGTGSPTESERVPGRLVGVGVGPGPASMVTVGALRALRRADRVVAPCTALDSVGRAEAILRIAAPDIVVERMKFVMQPDHQQRAAALRLVSESITSYLDQGEEVAFITLGDPNMYSTVSSVFDGVSALRPSTKTETIPGIMAFQALASKSDLMLTDEQQTLVVLPASASGETIEAELANEERTVVFYKGGGRISLVADQLEAANRLDTAAMGELIGMTGEQIAKVADVRDRPASYLSCVLAPATSGAGPKPDHTESTSVNGAS